MNLAQKLEQGTPITLPQGLKDHLATIAESFKTLGQKISTWYREIWKQLTAARNLSPAFSIEQPKPKPLKRQIFTPVKTLRFIQEAFELSPPTRQGVKTFLTAKEELATI